MNLEQRISKLEKKLKITERDFREGTTQGDCITVLSYLISLGAIGHSDLKEIMKWATPPQKKELATYYSQFEKAQNSNSLNKHLKFVKEANSLAWKILDYDTWLSDHKSWE